MGASFDDDRVSDITAIRVPGPFHFLFLVLTSFIFSYRNHTVSSSPF